MAVIRQAQDWKQNHCCLYTRIWSIFLIIIHILPYCTFADFSNSRKHVRWTVIHSKNTFDTLQKQCKSNTIGSFTYFYWCLVCMCYNWYFGSGRVSSGGWWCRPRSGASRRCCTTPCLRGAPCVSAVCLWWQRQQCTSAWGRKTFFKYRLSCSTHFKVRYILGIALPINSKLTELAEF